MCWRDHARRHALRCVLVIIAGAVTAAPGAAQDATASIETIGPSTMREAVAVGEEWLGPRRNHPADPIVRRPIWAGPGSMIVDEIVAEDVIRGWWPQDLADAKASALLDGFSRYLQTRIVERVFDQRYLRLAHHADTRAYLGDHVIWSFPTLRISREAAARRDPHAAVFLALERWIGGSTLQGAMRQVAQLPEAQLTGGEIIKTMSRAAGQDLSWAFDAAEHDVSYSITSLRSNDAASCASPCVDTTVTVARDAGGIFSGRSASASGAFESGDAIRLRVVFADGSDVRASWDGRAESRAFQFRGPSPATAAYLDPDRIVTLDRNVLDNQIVASSPTNVPVGKWVARWVVWLQHTMLSYGLLA